MGTAGAADGAPIWAADGGAVGAAAEGASRRKPSSGLLPERPNQISCRLRLQAETIEGILLELLSKSSFPPVSYYVRWPLSFFYSHWNQSPEPENTACAWICASSAAAIKSTGKLTVPICPLEVLGIGGLGNSHKYQILHQA